MVRSAILLLRDRREIGDRSAIRDYNLAIGRNRPSPITVHRVEFGPERRSPVHLRMALPESASRLLAALGFPRLVVLRPVQPAATLLQPVSNGPPQYSALAASTNVNALICQARGAGTIKSPAA